MTFAMGGVPHAGPQQGPRPSKSSDPSTHDLSMTMTVVTIPPTASVGF